MGCEEGGKGAVSEVVRVEWSVFILGWGIIVLSRGGRGGEKRDGMYSIVKSRKNSCE